MSFINLWNNFMLSHELLLIMSCLYGWLICFEVSGTSPEEGNIF